jgi:hypothetical protein
MLLKSFCDTLFLVMLYYHSIKVVFIDMDVKVKDLNLFYFSVF